MIRKAYPWLLFLAGVILGVFVSGRLVLQAQDRSLAPSDPGRSLLHEALDVQTPRTGPPRSDAARADRPGTTQSEHAVASDPGRAGGLADQSMPVDSHHAMTVQDALLHRYRFTFDRPTSLQQVCAHLKMTLKIPVVLDLAALDRQDVKPADTVALELDGVRLKTGLKLLLDQVGLTFRAVSEDNLLIITDREASEDPLDRVWTELRALHRDLHDVQDAVDELAESIGGEKGEGPRVRKPTIVEEMPEKERAKPEGSRDRPDRPHAAPDGGRDPAPASRPAPSRIPLGHTRSRLAP
jgi:hypothetical protein